MSARIAVIGSVNLDFVIETDKLPTAGETEIGGRFSTSPGGKGSNQALSARRLGGDVAFFARTGTDAYADLALANLHDDSVDLSGLVQRDGDATGAAFISVDKAGENQIAVASGANLAFEPADLPETIETEILLAQLEVPQSVVLAACERSDAFLILNTAPALPLEPALLTQIDLLILNQHELRDYGEALDDFGGMMAVTLGGDGAYLTKAGNEIARCDAFPVDVVDTTGAGDCFSGALAVAFAEGQSPETALRFACAAGALATTKLGAQSGMPTRSEVEALIGVS